MDKIRAFVFGMGAVGALVVLLGVGTEPPVGRYQIAASGSGSSSSRRDAAYVLDTVTGEVKMVEVEGHSATERPYAHNQFGIPFADMATMPRVPQ